MYSIWAVEMIPGKWARQIVRASACKSGMSLGVARTKVTLGMTRLFLAKSRR
jgi:hypothetical protein